MPELRRKFGLLVRPFRFGNNTAGEASGLWISAGSKLPSWGLAASWAGSTADCWRRSAGSTPSPAPRLSLRSFRAYLPPLHDQTFGSTKEDPWCVFRVMAEFVGRSGTGDCDGRRAGSD